MENIYLLFVAGAFGAFIREIIDDNQIKLPVLKDGILSLGFLGGIIIGAFAGYAIDGLDLQGKRRWPVRPTFSCRARCRD